MVIVRRNSVLVTRGNLRLDFHFDLEVTLATFSLTIFLRAFEDFQESCKNQNVSSRFGNVCEGVRRFARTADSAPIGGETRSSRDK